MITRRRSSELGGFGSLAYRELTVAAATRDTDGGDAQSSGGRADVRSPPHVLVGERVLRADCETGTVQGEKHGKLVVLWDNDRPKKSERVAQEDAVRYAAAYRRHKASALLGAHVRTGAYLRRFWFDGLDSSLRFDVCAYEDDEDEYMHATLNSIGEAQATGHVVAFAEVTVERVAVWATEHKKPVTIDHVYCPLIKKHASLRLVPLSDSAESEELPRLDLHDAQLKQRAPAMLPNGLGARVYYVREGVRPSHFDEYGVFLPAATVEVGVAELGQVVLVSTATFKQRMIVTAYRYVHPVEGGETPVGKARVPTPRRFLLEVAPGETGSVPFIDVSERKLRNLLGWSTPARGSESRDHPYVHSLHGEYHSGEDEESGSGEDSDYSPADEEEQDEEDEEDEEEEEEEVEHDEFDFPDDAPARPRGAARGAAPGVAEEEEEEEREEEKGRSDADSADDLNLSDDSAMSGDEKELIDPKELEMLTMRPEKMRRLHEKSQQRSWKVRMDLARMDRYDGRLQEFYSKPASELWTHWRAIRDADLRRCIRHGVEPPRYYDDERLIGHRWLGQWVMMPSTDDGDEDAECTQGIVVSWRPRNARDRVASKDAYWRVALCGGEERLLGRNALADARVKFFETRLRDEEADHQQALEEEALDREEEDEQGDDESDGPGLGVARRKVDKTRSAESSLPMSYRSVVAAEHPVNALVTERILAKKRFAETVNAITALHDVGHQSYGEDPIKWHKDALNMLYIATQTHMAMVFHDAHHHASYSGHQTVARLDLKAVAEYDARREASGGATSTHDGIFLPKPSQR